MSADGAVDVSVHLEEARRLLLDGGLDAQGLYLRWFHHETREVAVWPRAGAYRAALLDPARFEGGWRVVRAGQGPAGAVVAMRGGRERLVAPPEMLPEEPRNLAPGRGSAVRVHPLVSGEAGGFWHVWSAGWQKKAPARFQRVYCRITPGRALEFVARVAATAPPRPTWAMKALCGAHDAGRRDGALLYLAAGTTLDSGWVARLLEELQAVCRPALPPFVEPLGPGIGWAPDPGGGRSFGEAVSAAMASAAGHATDTTRFAATALAAVRALPGMRRSAAARA